MRALDGRVESKGLAIGRAPTDTVMPRSTAIVHDYLTQKGGAERVVLSMHRAFPLAPIYTALFEPDRTFPEFKQADVRTLALGSVGPLRRNHRLAMPLLAPAFSALRVKADVVLCSSSGWAHGTRVDGRKIVYCYTPARWLYQADRYLGPNDLAAKVALSFLRPALIRWDRRAARSADLYVAQSNVVRERIWDAYGVAAQMLPPPHSNHLALLQHPIHGLPTNFFLCVSRLLRYKNVDAVVGAFRRLPDATLVVVGVGPESERLRRTAGSNVIFTGQVPDAGLAWLYANCIGVIAAAYEDYGLVPLEAASFGKPVAALRWGGFLDTVTDGETGVFFDSPTPPAIHDAVQRLAAERFDSDALRAHAARYSEDQFIARLRGLVAEQADS